MKKWVLWVLLIAAGGAIAFALDMPVYDLVVQYVKPLVKTRLLGQLISGAEEFGQLVPILAISMAVWRLDRRFGRKVMVRIIVAALLASLVSETSKALIGRQRPGTFMGQTWQDTWIDAGFYRRHGQQQAFFSGHTAAAFATATVVGTCYPPVQPVVMVLAASCGVSRIAVRQHWTSDVYFGALAGMAIGWLLVPGVYRRGRMQSAALAPGNLP